MKEENRVEGKDAKGTARNGLVTAFYNSVVLLCLYTVLVQVARFVNGILVRMPRPTF